VGITKKDYGIPRIAADGCRGRLLATIARMATSDREQLTKTYRFALGI
jgi:hypothetical protein